MSNKSCKIIKKILRASSSSPANDAEFTSSLSDDIRLSWDVPDCTDCEVKGGTCGFQNNVSQHTGCFYSAANSSDMQQPVEGKGLKICRIIEFSIAAPAIICATSRRDLTSTCASRGQEQIAAMPQPQEAPTGLDQAIIDSYTKVVLGESCRVPGLNDGSCPICLLNFKAKEILRCIPDCQHCSHGDCIDNWLRMNGTYPLCRNSPAHHLQVQTEVKSINY